MFCFYLMILFITGQVVLTLFYRYRIRSAYQQRIGEGLDSFMQHFEHEEISADVLHVVYQLFQELQQPTVLDFPVRADDSIYKIYFINYEEVDDLVLEAIRLTGRQLPSPSKVCEVQTIELVRDVAHFVQKCPQIH